MNAIVFPQPEHWKKLLAKPKKLLWEHSVETAIMAKVFLTESNYSIDLEKMYEETDKSISKEKFLDSILFIIALHDLGKLHPYFQENLLSMPTSADFRFGFRHEQESARQLGIFLRKETTSPRRLNRSLPAIVAEHHQGKDESIYKDQAEAEADNSTVYNNDVRDMIAFVNDIWHFTPFDIIGRTNVFCQLFAGVLRFSDWAASSYYDVLSSKANFYYLEHCHKEAVNFLNNGGVIENHIPPRKYDYEKLCELSENKLYPLQKRVIEVLEEHPKAECILIEDQPGSGKTEGAFYAAVQLLQAYNYSSVYIALPTDATASEMIPRLEKCFKDHGLFQNSNIKLLTGKAWLRDDTKAGEDLDSKVEWETKARKLFNPLACGTTDQLMQVGIRLKAGDMRLLAVSNKCIIIDEFHAYDAYKMVILEDVLKWLRTLHVPVIIMSATLLEQTRRKIFSIFSSNMLDLTDYPRITCADDDYAYTYPCAPAKESTYMMKIIQYEDAIDKVLESVQTGGNTLFVLNTVEKAWMIYRMIRSKVSSKIKVRFYTGRTSPKNKADIGEKLVYLYGKKGKEDSKRPSKTIVVSTQIMEMSLDVDFDTVFSDIAPADALLQRMGRMARHDDKGTARENGFQSVFYLVSYKNKEKNWNLPYAETVLIGTEKVFSKYSSINTPKDIKTLIENSYKEAGPSWENAALRLAAHAEPKIIGDPNAGYKTGNGNISASLSDTMFSSYETETIICVPEGESIMDTKEWAQNAIFNWSVTVPKKKIADKIEELQETNKMTWLKNYKLVRNHEEFWGPDKQFIFGL